MKKILIILMGALLSFNLDASGGKEKASEGGTFEKPDFAFPKSVEKRAKDELKRSLPSRPENAVKALMQIVIAENSISVENFDNTMKLCDSVAKLLPTPYHQIVRSLQAEAYSECFNADQYNYSNLKLPLSEPWPENVQEWTRDMFAIKIMQLLQQSIQNESDLAAVPIDKISSLLDHCTAVDRRYVPSVYDVLAWRATELLVSFASQQSVIPFTTDASQLALPEAKASVMRSNIYNGLLKANADNPDAYALVISDICSPGKEDSAKRLYEAYKKMSDTPASLMLLDNLWRYVQASKENEKDDASSFSLGIKDYYNLCDKALKRYPDADYAPNVKSLLKQMSQARIGVTLKSNCLPADSLSAKLKVENINSFYLLLVKVNTDGKDRYVRNKELHGGTVVARKKVEVPGTVPFIVNETVEFAPVATGYYAVVASRTESLKDVIGLGTYDMTPLMRVGSLTAFTTWSSGGKADAVVYVIDAGEQKPVKGATVKQYATNYPDRGKLLKTSETDAQGACGLVKNNERLDINRGTEQFSMSSNFYNYSEGSQDVITHIKVLTDLPLYHPGDSIGIAAITYKETKNGFVIYPRCHLQAVLYSVNNERVDTIELVTDETGRAKGTLKIPSSGVLGNFNIMVKEPENKKAEVGLASVMVAEYKLPTFFVELDSIAPEYTPGSEVSIKGSVKTYSGMPVGGATVTLKVDYSPLLSYWRFRDNSATYGVLATADSEGKFSFSLPTSNLKGTVFENGIFTVQATAVSPAGESQQSQTEIFSLGQGYSLNVSVPDKISALENELKISAKVLNGTGTEVNKEVRYVMTDEASGKKMLSGYFTSPEFVIPIKELPSGRYKLNFTLAQDTSVKAESQVAVYRKTDKIPPYVTSLWLPEKVITATPGAGTVKVQVGNSYKSEALLCQIASDTALISRRWIYPEGKNMTVEVPVPGKNSRIYVSFISCHDFIVCNEEVEIRAADADRKLDIEVVTFRDKLVPGKNETWSFRFRDTVKGLSGSIPALAVMTDKAINALYDFDWYFSTSRGFSSPVRWNYNNPLNTVWNYYAKIAGREKSFGFVLPNIETYNQSFYPVVLYDYAYVRPLMKQARSVNSVMTMASVSNDMATEESADESEAPTAGAMLEGKALGVTEAQKKPEQKETWRRAEYPLAFFKPMLISEEDGSLDVEFEVPDFNTTWQFQLLGYDKEMNTAKKTLYSVASKPIMIQALVPRFLRTSDKAALRATLYNNTDAAKVMQGTIEVFNPMNGQILAHSIVNGLHVKAKESVVISLDYTTPDNEQTLGIRVRAKADGFTDGEQSLVGILPNSSPVFEAKDFYLGPQQNEFSMKLPEYKAGSNVTLQYCDNPVWYCVTALPEISIPESDNLISLTSAYFGNALASGLVKRYPRIGEAINLWQGTQTLTSPLQRNSELKTLALNNTIWARNANAETMRMSRLAELLDVKKSEEAQASLLKKISSLQCEDGGWQWMPGMDPSLYLTTNVLLYMGQLKQMGCLPEATDVRSMLSKALKFADAEVLKEYDRIKAHKLPFPTQYMLSYFYIRSFYGDVPVTGRLKQLRSETMRNLISKWRGLDVYNTATAAVTLFRNGYRTNSASILESLRQKASSTPEKGLWFDNLRSTWSSFNTLITTAQVLEAYCEIEPEAKEIDPLRQWLILQRQAQDWGNDRDIAEVVYAILSSGSDWTRNTAPATFTLGDKVLEPDSVQALTGEFTMSLNAVSASGATFKVLKHGSHPAWGGVLSQFILPMAQVKPASVPDLSIEKNVYVISNGAAGETVTQSDRLKVGDKVRVTLTITCGRDMEYVAVTDERPACFEPVNQLPGMQMQDDTFYYSEPRNAQTNFFISYLGKGVHTLSYDCYVQQEGSYSIGIATAQSQYAPLLTGHSAGAVLSVSGK